MSDSGLSFTHCSVLRNLTNIFAKKCEKGRATNCKLV